MKYNHFTLNDFVLDDDFVNWVKSPNPQSEAFWQDWLENHPDKKGLIEEARQMIRALSVPGKQLSEPDKRQMWEKINQRRVTHPVSGSNQRGTSSNQHFIVEWLYKGRIAASIAAILVIAAVWMWMSKSQQLIQYKTQYSEIKQVRLPDGSHVTLNANSSLSFSSDWDEQADREVHLTGEAFFNVTKKPGRGNARFVVHTPALNVEVLGTKFNVNNRREKVQVVLQEGKVALSQPGVKGSSVSMAPGDYVEYSQRANSMHRKKVNPLLYSSWKDEEMVFEEKPLYEIAQILEDTQGLQVVFLNDSIPYLSFTGTLPNHDVDHFLMVLSKSFQIDVSKTGNKIVLDKK